MRIAEVKRLNKILKRGIRKKLALDSIVINLLNNKLRTAISDNQKDMLKNSISKAGIIESIVVVSNRDGTFRIISGEKRYIIAHQLRSEGKDVCPAGVDVILINENISKLDEQKLIVICNLYSCEDITVEAINLLK